MGVGTSGLNSVERASHERMIDTSCTRRPICRSGVTGRKKRLCVRATPGGQHPGRGTRTRCSHSVQECTVEILVLLEQPTPPQPRAIWHRCAQGATARRGPQRTRSRATIRTKRDAGGVTLGELIPGSRKRYRTVLLSGVTPIPRTWWQRELFLLIDWGRRRTRPPRRLQVQSLIDLRAEHPDADHVRCS